MYGLKATFGRIPRTPRGSCYSVCHIGPLTANFDDLVLAYSVLAGPSEDDLSSQHQPPVHAADLLSADVRGLRIGVYPEHLANSSPEIFRAVTDSIAVLQARGAVIVNITLPHLHIINKAHTVVITTEIGGGSYPNLHDHFNDYSPEVQLVFGT